MNDPAAPSNPGERADARIRPAVADAMREIIAEAGGNEVFFAGSLDKDSMLESVRVCARGHKSAVPALMEGLGRNEIVLHNHPSGNLTPSEADLHLAALYSQKGHGAYIIDNQVARVYVMVEPIRAEPRKPLARKPLETILSDKGPLARALPDYEVRHQQIEMLHLVTDGFNNDTIAVIEAPTGVGKTLAYLLPAVTWAQQNHERVVIATKTINLQEQIIFKDVPLLQECLEAPFSAVLVKGRNNYLCPRRLQRALSEATLFQEEDEADELKAIAVWAEKTQDGTRSDLPFVPKRETWENICSDADMCTGAQCHAEGNCFLTKARRALAKADLIIANHHVLFSDLAVKKEVGDFGSTAVLPPYYRVIIDEAHNVEDSATQYFGNEATRNGALMLFSRFVRIQRRAERGLLPLTKQRLVTERHEILLPTLDAILDLIDTKLVPALAEARDSITLVFDVLRSIAAEGCGKIGRDIKWRLTPEILANPEWRDLHDVHVLPCAEDIHIAARHTDALVRHLRAIRDPKDPEILPFLPEISQLQGYRDRLLRLAKTLTECTNNALQENAVRWVEIDANNDTICRLCQCPLDISIPLAEWVYPQLRTVIMTSATLSVRNRFDFLFERLGLDATKPSRVNAAALESPFDFERQARLYLFDDLPAPEDKTFLTDSEALMEAILHITDGHAFILFTSFYALDHAYRALEKTLRKHGITPLKQGADSRTRLLDRFRTDTSSVLFATDSFWEGVDVAGAALQCVILPKLPFRVPTEPVLQARSEAIDAAGNNAFMTYSVPQAVIRFRQGFGRLIRRKSDRGTVIVLDKRISTRFYGKMFLESLPPISIMRGPRQALLDNLQDWHSTKGRSS